MPFQIRTSSTTWGVRIFFLKKKNLKIIDLFRRGRSTCQGALLTSAESRARPTLIAVSPENETGNKKSEFFTNKLVRSSCKLVTLRRCAINLNVGSLMAINEMDTPSFDNEMKRRIG